MFDVVFVFALVLLGFAAVHDWKTTFVSDWVVYALFCVGLVSLIVEGRVLEGLGVTAGLSVLALMFYYGGVFAQGDARLLVALGPVLPGVDLVSRGWYGGGFVLSMLVIGLGYTLVMSGTYAFRTQGYASACQRLFLRYKPFFWGILGFGLMSAFFLSLDFWLFVMGGGLVLFSLFLHAKSVEETCFIVRTAPGALLEGDWLVSSVHVGRKVLRPSPGGLSRADIALLRKYKRAVVIKQGIPFVPVFFIAYALMGYVVLGGSVDEVVQVARGFLS